jgi:hypothetical protein
MSFTLPWTVNKLVSTNINDANSVTGTYGAVSLKVNGKSELTGDTVLINKVAIGKNVSSYPLDVSGNLNASGFHINGTPLGNSFSTRNITVLALSNSIAISNSNFSTPAQSAFNFTAYSPPYTAISNWSISTVSGTPYTVYVGRSFTSLVNSFDTLYPDYPLFSQYLSFQGTDITNMAILQNITFATAGAYLLTFYGWGEYNRYSTTMTLSASLGSGSIVGAGLIEQGWTKISMKFSIGSAGTYPLVINMVNSAAINSGCSISGIKIVSAVGMTVSDGGTANNQLIMAQGCYTSGEILNRGQLTNFGLFRNYGGLQLYLPFSSGSLVIGSAGYGSNDSTLSLGKYNVFIGQSVAVQSSVNTLCEFNGLVAIGFGALEQATTLSRAVAIGYQANRYNVNDTLTPDCIGIGYQANQAIGYAGGNSPRNVAIGSYVLSGAYSSSADNTVVGHSSMSSANFSNGRSFNSVFGSSSLNSVVSNHNSSIGYQNANNIVNTGSNYNTFIGSQVCATQSGSSNVLLNCTFLGATSNVSASGNYSNSTCVGFGSLITGNNQIILGRGTETTFCMGGLNIPVATILTLLGNISANSLTITPVQLSFLNNVSAGAIPSTVITNSSFVALTGAQTIAGIKTFSSPPVMSGASITSATIPQSSIVNVGDFLKASSSASVSGVWSFTNTVNLSGAVNVSGTMSFTTNPVFNTDAINPLSIDNSTTPRFVDLSTGQNISGAKIFNDNITLGSSSSNFINLIGNLYDVVTATSVTPLEVTCLAGCTSNIQTTLNTLNTKTTAISYNSGTTTTSFANNVSMSNINPSGLTDLNIGNSSQTTKIKGALTVEDGAQKVNGYSTLSGSPNNLSKPLSEYYTLATSSNGALTLPVIDSSMYGSQITFTKLSTAAIWTINAGTGNTFRLYKSNSTATATSVLMEYNETVLRIVATQATVWDVIQTDVFYNAASDWVVGTQYFPMLMAPTNITGATNWNVSLPAAFYGIHGFSISANSTLTLPLSTNINVPDGLRIKFRRVGGTLATTLNCTSSTGDTVMAQSSTGTSPAGTAVVLVNTSVFFGEIYLNKTTKIWYCM